MNKPSTTSVAMCTCNGGAYIREQLDSLLAQTLRPKELIVSDDASTDETAEILNAFKESAPFPVAVFTNDTRAGVCMNFENAVRHCSGEIIFLADQDDIWMPDKIATTLAVFDRHPRCGYVFSNADLIDEHGNDLGRDLWESIGFDKKQQATYAGHEQLNVMLRRFTLAYGMTMAFRASFKSKLLPFQCQFWRAIVHDGWISLLLSSLGAYGVAVPLPLVRYRQHSRQLASAGAPLSLRDLTRNKRSAANESNLDFADFLEYLALRLDQEETPSEYIRQAGGELRQKAMHLRARVHANSHRGLERLKTVLAEAASGRYGRYSRSFKSIIKDLTTS